MAKRLCLVDDLKLLKITMSNTSSRNKLNPKANDHYNIFTRESQEYELKTKDKASKSKRESCYLVNGIVPYLTSWVCMMARGPEHRNSSVKVILHKEKLSGSNFLEWYYELRTFLKVEGKLVHLEQPLPPTPLPVEPVVVCDAYAALYNAQLKVECLMLAIMTPDLQKNLEE
ncbi:hypothetical protein Tco_0497855 [Tanacetum coccineum]